MGADTMQNSGQVFHCQCARVTTKGMGEKQAHGSQLSMSSLRYLVTSVACFHAGSAMSAPEQDHGKQ